MQKVLLSIRGRQHYEDQEPEDIELVTEGTLELRDGGIAICYEESELTGLSGATTRFWVQGDTVTLTREGTLNSQMVFRPGYFHDSLYQTEFGLAMQITVCASRVEAALTERGGTLELVYAIEIEKTTAGLIEYHLEIKPI